MPFKPFLPNEGFGNAIVAISHPRDLVYNRVLSQVMELANEHGGIRVIGGLDDDGQRWLKLTILKSVPPEGIEPSSMG